MRGTVQLTFDDMALNSQPADKLLGNTKPEQDFDIPAKESRSCAWRIHVPDGAPFPHLQGRRRDGQRVRRRGRLSAGAVAAAFWSPSRCRCRFAAPATKKFEFTKLLNSGNSKTLQNQSLSVEMVSQPGVVCGAGAAVSDGISLRMQRADLQPALCQRAGAHTSPTATRKSARVFDQWKNTPALDVPLEKNQDLKAVMIEETPWLRQAENESQARRNVGILFDDNRLNYETDATLRKLTEMQLDDGSLAVVPRRAGQRLHHALHHHRLWPAAAPRARTSTRPRPSARSSGWMTG